MKTTEEMITDLEEIGMPSMPPMHPTLGVPMIVIDWAIEFMAWSRERRFSVGSNGYFGA